MKVASRRRMKEIAYDPSHEHAAEVAPVTLHGKNCAPRTAHQSATVHRALESRSDRSCGGGPLPRLKHHDMRAYIAFGAGRSAARRRTALCHRDPRHGPGHWQHSVRRIVPRTAARNWMTWLTPAHQRTVANTEAKFLLLTHAFEVLRAIRVNLKRMFSTRSRATPSCVLAPLGGTFRKHVICDPACARHHLFFHPRYRVARGEAKLMKFSGVGYLRDSLNNNCAGRRNRIRDEITLC